MNQTLKLPKVLRTFVEEQVKTQGLKSSDTYIAQLIKAEKKRLGIERLIQDLNAAKASPGEVLTLEEFDHRMKAKLEEFARKKADVRNNSR